MICATWDSPAISTRDAQSCAQRADPLHKEVQTTDGIFRVYWLPIPGYPDLYVHFTTEPIVAETKECRGMLCVED